MSADTACRSSASCAHRACALAAARLRRARGGTARTPRSRFSDLADITPANVGRLQVAWTFHTGEFPGGQPNPTRPVTSMQSRPLLVGDLLIVTTTTSKVLAIDARSGRGALAVRSVRRHDAHVRGARPRHVGVGRPRRGRGHRSAARSSPARATDGWSRSTPRRAARAPHSRITASSICGPAPMRVPARPTRLTSPPAIYKNLVIVGAMVPEETSQGPSGDVRAFDARTGRQVWRFHTVPQPGEFGHETWPEGTWQRRTGVNVWTSMARRRGARAGVPAGGVRARTTSTAPTARAARCSPTRSSRSTRRRARGAGTSSSCTTTSGTTTRRRSPSSPTSRATARPYRRSSN